MPYIIKEHKCWSPLYSFRAFTPDDGGVSYCEECGRAGATEENGYLLCDHCYEELDVAFSDED